MQAEFAAVIGWLTGAILLVALVLCFLGFKAFRGIAALTAFLLVALGFIALMQRQTMGTIVTTFTLIGLIVGFLVFQWHRVAGFIIGGALGFSLAALVTGNIWVALGVALLFAVLCAIFTTVLVIAASAAWGGIVLAFRGLPLLGTELLWLKILVAVLLVAAGLTVQILTNKKALKKEVKAT